MRHTAAGPCMGRCQPANQFPGRPTPLHAQDVMIGDAARPQLARTVHSIAGAAKCMEGRPFVVQAKLDGERLQVIRRHACCSEYRFAVPSPSVCTCFLDRSLASAGMPEQCMLRGGTCLCSQLHSQPGRIDYFGRRYGLNHAEGFAYDLLNTVVEAQVWSPKAQKSTWP